ncbi:MAG: class I SAM-dependent methyltransferase [Bacteriovoracaceae bacterium]|nr:class I SAM-dependent methyltransferase [Bacteriovoracaceae bacterium]
MSGVFLDYAKYYDALYKDKDYKGEAEFITHLIHKYAPNAKSILNIGCGTGQHDVFLAEKGFHITGVDRSEHMIEIAKHNNKSPHCKFLVGDGVQLDLAEEFDVVISLFHVLSYQTLNQDVIDFLKTAKHNLKVGGVCIIDYWYGPAVLSIKPEKRTKQFSTEEISVTRNASTTLDYAANVATVNFDIEIKNIADQKTSQLHEKHPMRYFFSPEIKLFAEVAGLQQIHHAAWMQKDVVPSDNSWAVYSILKK